MRTTSLGYHICKRLGIQIWHMTIEVKYMDIVQVQEELTSEYCVLNFVFSLFVKLFCNTQPMGYVNFTEKIVTRDFLTLLFVTFQSHRDNFLIKDNRLNNRQWFFHTYTPFIDYHMYEQKRLILFGAFTINYRKRLLIRACFFDTCTTYTTEVHAW